MAISSVWDWRLCPRPSRRISDRQFRFPFNGPASSRAIGRQPERTGKGRAKLFPQATDWANELHPTEQGFNKIAAQFLQALRKKFPGWI
jgi:hypothetical protein